MIILNKDDLADYLKVSLKTVCYLLYSKQLPKIKIGREYRFLKDDIDHWLNKQRCPVTVFSFKEKR